MVKEIIRAKRWVHGSKAELDLKTQHLLCAISGVSVHKKKKSWCYFYFKEYKS
jgi:hypothetical protein